MAFILVIKDMLPLFVCFVLSLSLYRLGKLDVRIGLRNIRPFIWLFLFTLVLHMLFTPGDPLVRLSVFNLCITKQGIFQGIFYTSRIILFIIIANLLTLTTSPLSLTDAIESLLTPFKRMGIPAHEIAMMMSIALRFIPILLDEADRIYKAQISRGAVIEGNLFQKLKGIIPIILPLFLSAFRKADELALAMDARCYRGGVGRTSFQVLQYKKQDVIAFTMTAFVCLMIVLYRAIESIGFQRLI